MKLQSYLKADSTALLVITTNLSEECLQKVLRFSNARDVWLELHRLYDGISEDRAYDLCMKFFGYKKMSGDDMATHLSKIKNIWFELTLEMLKSEGKELPEMFIICKILETLPDEYFSFKSSLLLMTKKDRSIENLTSTLCAYERALSAKNS